MPLVKTNRAAPLIHDAVVLDLGDLGVQAARLRSDAQAKAASILEDAKSQATQLIESAHGQGHEQGYQEGLDQGREQGHREGYDAAYRSRIEQIEQLTATWRDVIQQWESHRSDMERQARQACVEFALRVAETLVHRVIEVDETVINDQVAAALQHVLKPMDVTIHIHPDDRPVLEANLPELANEFRNLKHAELMGDDRVGRGGCMLTYGQGQIDATLETQFRRIVEQILPGPEAEPIVAREPGIRNQGPGKHDEEQA